MKAGTPTRFLTTQFTEAGAVFSPDGRWVAYHSDKSGKSQVVRPSVPGLVREGSRAAGFQQRRMTTGMVAEWRRAALSGRWANHDGQLYDESRVFPP